MLLNSTYIEDADEELTDIAIKEIHNKYAGEQIEDALTKIKVELENIRRQGSAYKYLTAINAFNAVNAKSEEYCPRGTLPSLLISYVTGLSDVNPLNCSPCLYPEIAQGIKGDKLPCFEFNVSSDLHRRLFDYYDNYPGEGLITRKYDEKGRLVGVYIGEINKISATVEPLGRTFYINFVEVIDSLELKNNLLHNKIIELCKPGNLEEYVKCYGFKHSTGAWENNAEVLLKEGIVSFDELIANREDVYEYLLDLGVDKPMAFTIAEYVRMGKVKKQGWKEEMYTVMKSKGTPEWFIKSCEKVDYLFTRAHAISLYKSYTDL